MKQKRTYVTVLLVVALLALGVAYAALQAQNVEITTGVATTADTGNIDVEIVSGSKQSGATNATATLTVDEEDATKAELSVAGLTKAEEEIVVLVTVQNNRSDVDATLSKVDFTNTNTNWFDVTSAIVDSDLERSGTATATITVKLKKTVATEADLAAAVINGLKIQFTATPDNN